MKHRHQSTNLGISTYLRGLGHRALGLAASLLVLLAIASIGQPSQAGQSYPFRVIVNPESPVESLSVSEIRAKFYKKDMNWPDGTEVLPVDLPVDSKTRAAFSDAILGKTPEDVQKGWFQRTFDGLTPPAEATSNAEVTAYVKSTPGAIGYISRGASLGGTRSIEITEEPAPIPEPEAPAASE